MEACLAANWRYFKKENVKCTVLESKDDFERINLFSFIFFFPFFLEEFTELFSQNQL